MDDIESTWNITHCYFYDIHPTLIESREELQVSIIRLGSIAFNKNVKFIIKYSHFELFNLYAIYSIPGTLSHVSCIIYNCNFMNIYGNGLFYASDKTNLNIRYINIY